MTSPLAVTARNAVVTGAASGMGRILATRLAGAGTAVHAIDRDAEALDRLAEQQSGIVPHACDVTDAEALERLLAPIAKDVDLLVTAAGIGHTARIADTPVATFERIAKINYLGTVATIAPVLPAMLEAGRGRVVIFASMAGWVPAPGHGPYNAVKSALIMYAEVLRSEVGSSGVRVHCVCPPTVATPLLDDMPISKQSLGLIKAMKPEVVVDAIQAAMDRNRFWVFPDFTSKFLWRLRRHAPRVTAALLSRMIGTGQVRPD